MKNLLLLLLCLPIIGFGQQTYVPDDNFETYLENNGIGDGIALNDYVTTASIDTVTELHLSSLNINDLTGIEDFTALTYLFCDNNQLTSLNISANTALITLRCMNNQLTSLDVSYNANLDWLSCSDNQLTSLGVSYNANLDWLSCGNNQLTSLDVSTNTNLTKLWCNDNQLTNLDVSTTTSLTDFQCHSNQLTSLDVSTNTALTYFSCNSNQLTSLDVKNGNNTNLSYYVFNSTGNPNLNCINVDDAAWSAVNWTVANGNIDPHHYFSNNCGAIAIEEHSTNKELLKITDLLGRETTNNPIFYIYDDGTVEKRIIVE